MAIYPVSLIELIDSTEIEKLLVERKNLQLGEILEGQVIKLFNESEALIDFGRFRARAMLQVPLIEGEKFNVQVVETGKHVQFQVQTNAQINSEMSLNNQFFNDKLQWLDPGKLFSNLAKLLTLIEPAQAGSTALPAISMAPELSASTAPSTLIQGLEQSMPQVVNTTVHLLNLLKPIDLDSGAMTIATRIRQFSRGSGLLWENQLLSTISSMTGTDDFAEEKFDWNRFVRVNQQEAKLDIKAQLILLNNQLFRIIESQKMGGSVPKSIIQARQEVEEFLNVLSTQQREIVNDFQNRADNQAVFSFILPFEEKKIKGKLKLYLRKGKAKNNSKQGWRISLLLDLSVIGGVRVDFYYLKELLRLTVYVKDRYVQEWILEESKALLDALGQYIESVHIDVLVSKKKIDNYETEDWLEEGVAKSFVDLKV